MAQHFRRTRNLIEPGFQLRIGALFVMAVVIAVVLFGVVLFLPVTQMFDPDLVDVAAVESTLLDLMVSKGLVVLGFCAVLTMALAIVITFRIVGPIYRMSRFLEDVKSGSNPPPCTLRKGDAFHDFCELLNETTEPLRVPPSGPVGGERVTRRQAEAVDA